MAGASLEYSYWDTSIVKKDTMFYERSQGGLLEEDSIGKNKAL